MKTNRFVLCAFAVLCGTLALVSKTAYANDLVQGDDLRPYINTHQWTPEAEPIKFTVSPPKPKKDMPLIVPYLGRSGSVKEEPRNNFDSRPDNDQSWEDKILNKIPQGKRLKYMWNVADGDIDLMGIKGFRGDRGNKGVTYSTHYVPFIGDMESVEFRFDAGEDTEFIFKSSHIPFMGELEGFNFKVSAKDNRQRVFARYTIPFDY